MIRPGMPMMGGLYQQMQQNPGMPNGMMPRPGANPLSPQAGGIPPGMFNRTGGGSFKLNTEGMPRGGPNSPHLWAKPGATGGEAGATPPPTGGQLTEAELQRAEQMRQQA